MNIVLPTNPKLRFYRRGARLLILIIALLAIAQVSRNVFLDSGKRANYEQFLTEIMVLNSFSQGEVLKTGNEAGQPEMAAFHDVLMTLDPALGYVPRERLLKSYLEIQNQSIRRKSNPILQWSGTSANMGGRTRAIMWDPNDATGKKVWAGSVTGGLWFRNNITSNSAQWQPVNNFWPSLNISCMTYDPNDPLTFYVGTGEAQTALVIYRESSGVGDGIWKSSDGGITWFLLESTFGFEYVTDIRVRNENGNSVIYAGVTSGIYKGTTHTSEPSDGLFRSDDGGLSWEQVLPNIPGYNQPYSISDIEIGADGRIYLGTMQNVNIKGGATILYSDQGLAGTWTVYNQYVGIIQNQPYYNIPGRVVLSCAPSNSNIVYAAIAAGYVAGFNRYIGRYILKSSNKGASWSQKDIPDSEWAPIAWHAMVIKVDPEEPNRIFAGGKDMWLSNNSGSSWSQISDWTLMYSGGGDDYLHCDHHSIEFKPGNPDVFLECGDGGVFYTTTAGNNHPDFIEKNQGFNTLQFYTCDIHPSTGTSMYLGGLQDNGTLLFDGAPLSINNMIDEGDGAFCFFDENDPNLWLTSTYYNRYRVFIDGNQTDFLDYYSGIFINPADFDSRNNTLFANAVDFYGGSQNRILRIKDIPENPIGNYVTLSTGTNVYFSHIKVSPWSPEGSTTLFIGTQSGRVYRVDNANQYPVVTEITSDNFPTAYVSCIEVGQSEEQLLVTFSNYGVASVWLTSDGGSSWTNVEGDLPDIPVRWAILHPDNENQALLATELGVWSTTVLNSTEVTWEQEIVGMANVRVDMLKLRKQDNTVLAATHGRGLFTAFYPLEPCLFIKENEEHNLHVFPNPTLNTLNVRLPSGTMGHGKLVVFDGSGICAVEKRINLTPSDLVHVNVSGLQKGNYVVMVFLDNKKYSAKFTKE